jgi:hypothetical protein
VQRSLIKHHANTLTREYDPRLFGLGHVSLRDDGHYYGIDCQHRCYAAVQSGHGDIPVKFKVYKGLSLREEADLFERLNANRIRVNPVAAFKVRVVAEDKDALAITKILRGVGLHVPETLSIQEGGVCAVRALEDIYHGKTARKCRKEPSPALLEDTLGVLTSAFGTSHEAFEAGLLKSVAALLDIHGEAIDRARLANVLGRQSTPRSLLAQIRGSFSTSKGQLAEAGVQILRNLYNQRLREDRKLKG